MLCQLQEGSKAGGSAGRGRQRLGPAKTIQDYIATVLALVSRPQTQPSRDWSLADLILEIC